MSTKTFAAALALAAAAALFTIPATASAAPYTNCDVESAALSLNGEEPEVFTAINKMRADAGIPAVVHSTVLARPAEWASDDSAKRGVSPSNHVDTLGRDITTRFRQCGIPSNTARIAEINYWGTNITPADAMKFWANSPTHKAIILDNRLARVGVSVIYLNGHQHWTVTFASAS